MADEIVCHLALTRKQLEVLGQILYDTDERCRETLKGLRWAFLEGSKQGSEVTELMVMSESINAQVQQRLMLLRQENVYSRQSTC